MNEISQTKTWRELKEFCNSLNESQLDAPLKIEITEQPFKRTVFAYISPDDYLINSGDSDDYGYRNEIPFGIDNENTESDYIIITRKGEPVLSCDN